MRTWANSGLTNAARTGAMLALGRTSPPSTGSVVEPGPVIEPGPVVEPRPVVEFGPVVGSGSVVNEPRSGQFPRYPASQGWPVTDALGSDRSVNPTDGFLAGGAAALAASSVPSSLPSWGADAGAIGSWGTSVPLTPMPVVPPPPLAEMTQVSELTRITDRTPAPDPATMSDAADSPLLDSSALGSLDSSGLFGALSQRPR